MLKNINKFLAQQGTRAEAREHHESEEHLLEHEIAKIAVNKSLKNSDIL